MKGHAVAGVIAMLAIALTPGAARADQVYLDATFNHAAIDAPIGTRGALYGEPSWIHENVSAIVRAAPFATPCLEISDTDPVQAGLLGFRMLDNVEVRGNTISVALDLWFDEIGPGREFLVRIATLDYLQKLVELYFRSDGNIQISSQHGPLGTLGSYEAGRPFPVLIGFAQDAGTYSIWLDGDQAVADEPTGVTAGGLGVVMIGAEPHSLSASRLWIDRIRVTDGVPDTPAETTTWGAIKALFRP
jgi:hypothetical protein